MQRRWYHSSMSIELPSELETRIRRKLGDRYRSADDVIGEALDLLDQRDAERMRIHEQVRRGLEELERGEYREFDSHSLKAFVERIKADGRAASNRA